MMDTPELTIAKAMDAWRIRLWLHKGPRCPCRCGERVPWSAVKKTDVFDTRKHIPTGRRPYRYECNQEESYIPSTLEGFRQYLAERRHVLHAYSMMLFQYCMNMDESWILTFLSNGHAAKAIRNCHTYRPTSMPLQLVKWGWHEAANIMLSWPETACFTEEDMMYLVKKPYRTGYEHMDMPLTNPQRNWLLNHPALMEKSRKARNHKHWMQILLWTVYVRSEMWFWKKARAPLPAPSKKNVPAFQARITRGEYRLRPGTPFYQDLLGWVSFLAKESPGTLRTLLPKMGKESQWLSDVIETLVPTGRIGLLNNCLRVFGRTAPMPLQKEKIWKWADDHTFATPRITKQLIFMATSVFHWASQNNQKKGLLSKLFNAEAIVRTIDQNAVWLSNKLPDSILLSYGKKRCSYKVVADALKATPRYQSLRHIATLRATVYLTIFFQNHVRLSKTKTVIHGDCPICWAPKILQPLHGDTLHGMCYGCKRDMERNNLLDRCPMCRVLL